MTLDETITLLSKKGIPFELCEFQNEAKYWHHTMLFPYTKNAKHCKVIAIIIRSINEKKNIELQFNAVDDVFRFEELRFGEFCYEMFDVKEEFLADDLMARIAEIKSGRFTVISANDIIKKCWRGDICFDRDDDDMVFGEPGFQNAMKKIRKPKGFFAKLSKTVKQYEIYDWNTYQLIIK